ncbi:MAG: iron-containing alcohol dehydrogenase [Candidatus Aminicenantes bacterium]|nr:iron-containing alcohol dehydrogenase [Candidatus Aminicenantes bacterium]
MNPFSFYLPTKIVFGKGKIKEFESYVSSEYQKILIVTDRGVEIKSDALKIIQPSLKNRTVSIFSDVEENPSFSTLEKGKKMAKEAGAQLILGVGGGSPMDAAKGIAVLATNNKEMRSYMSGTELATDPLPIVCIPTTSGTGSEVTPYAVFSDTKNQNKGGYAHTGIYPSVSIIDPELTYSMPEELIINTGLDALTHAIEAYLSTESTDLSDNFSIHAIQTILENLTHASQKNHSAMDRLSYAAMIAGIAISMAGTILLHIMAYPLTIFHHIPHGRANAVLLSGFMTFMEKNSTVPEKVAVIKEMFDGKGGISGYINEFGITTQLSSLGVKEEELKTFVNKTIVKDDIHITPAPISKSDIYQIYKKSM